MLAIRPMQRPAFRSGLAIPAEKIPALDLRAAAVRMVKHDPFGQVSRAEQTLGTPQPALQAAVGARHVAEYRRAHVEREAQMLFHAQGISLDVRSQSLARMLAIGPVRHIGAPRGLNDPAILRRKL